jgi:hypothetical protein
MTETQQHLFARWIFEQAQIMAFPTNQPEDREAATMAILVEALTLATPSLSAERRSGLFLENEE